MVPEHFSEEAFAALRALPFVETAADGLAVHETVRAAIAASLRALDPERHQALRRAAWTCLRAEVAGAARAQRWRYMADLLYLVDRPQVREAFFPSDGPSEGEEAARPAARHSRPRTRSKAGPRAWAWWAANAFHVVRAPAGILAFMPSRCRGGCGAAGRDPKRTWLTTCAGNISADLPVFFEPRWLGGRQERLAARHRLRMLDVNAPPTPMRRITWAWPPKLAGSPGRSAARRSPARAWAVCWHDRARLRARRRPREMPVSRTRSSPTPSPSAIGARCGPPPAPSPSRSWSSV
jgi:hypothetical protein